MRYEIKFTAEVRFSPEHYNRVCRATIPAVWEIDVVDYPEEVLEEYGKVRAQTAGDGTEGGYLIPPEVSNEIIDLTIANMPLMSMGITELRGLRGDLPVPKLTGRPTGYWVGENEKPILEYILDICGNKVMVKMVIPEITESHFCIPKI